MPSRRAIARRTDSSSTAWHRPASIAGRRAPAGGRDALTWPSSTPADAEQAGFRACRRCQPDEGRRLIRGSTRSGGRASIWPTSTGIPRLRRWPRRFGGSPYHLQRNFKRIVGVTPREYAEACRLRKVKRRLRQARRRNRRDVRRRLRIEQPFLRARRGEARACRRRSTSGGAGMSISLRDRRLAARPAAGGGDVARCVRRRDGRVGRGARARAGPRVSGRRDRDGPRRARAVDESDPRAPGRARGRGSTCRSTCRRRRFSGRCGRRSRRFRTARRARTRRSRRRSAARAPRAPWRARARPIPWRSRFPVTASCRPPAASAAIAGGPRGRRRCSPQRVECRAMTQVRPIPLARPVSQSRVPAYPRHRGHSMTAS